ncbi:MAG: O-antigen ligase family protein [Candidatus Alcyoniella australis]|nr:O-antigen ligase family protein [Candidatus Alcyoniella australis]
MVFPRSLLRRLKTPGAPALVGLALIPLALIAAYAIANFRPLWLLGVFALAGSLVLLTRIEIAALFLPLVIFLPDIGRDLPGPFALFVHDLMILALFGLYAIRQIASRRPVLQIDRRAAFWLLAFIAIAGASLIKAAMLDRAIFLAGVKDWIRLVELTLMTVALAGMIQTRKQARRLLLALCLAGAAAVGVALWAYVHDSEALYRVMNLKRATVQIVGLRYRMVSSMGTAAHTGVCFATLAALATALVRRGARRWTVIFGLALIVLCLVCVVLTFSKGTWVALALAMLVLWTSGRLPRAWIFAVGALAVTGALALMALWGSSLDPGVLATDFFRLSRSSAEIRLARWASVQNVMLREPLLGVGYNCYAYVYGRFAVDSGVMYDYGHPHNMFIDVLTGSGIAGLVMFLGFCSRVLGLARRLTVERGGLAGLGRACYLALLIYFGASLFNSFLFKAGRAGMLLFAVIGLVLALDRMRSEIEDDSDADRVAQQRELERPVAEDQSLGT